MGRGGIAPPFVSALDEGEWSASRPDRFISGTYCICGWVGPRVNLNAVEYSKISYSCRESNPDLPVRSTSLYRQSYSGSYIHT
jgi:hypothetical protein